MDWVMSAYTPAGLQATSATRRIHWISVCANLSHEPVSAEEVMQDACIASFREHFVAFVIGSDLSLYMCIDRLANWNCVIRYGLIQTATTWPEGSVA
jgi:hypothetical protein